MNTNTLAEKYFKQIQSIRHQIHEHPEIGYEEVETSKLIKKELDQLGIPYVSMCGTGVVGLIQGKYPGKTVLLRADMDALEVEEEADVPFKSKIKGKMHACGHDGHVAGLLGAAMILNELKDDMHGQVKLMFQPSEEKDGGAKPMIEAGILENPKVDVAFGIHLWGPVKEGVVKTVAGPMMAAPDEFKVTIKGRGTHAAMPHLGVDPIVVASQVITQLQTIVSRFNNPLLPAVLSVCTIHGGEAFNVIPTDVTFGGTVRTFDETLRTAIEHQIKQVVEGVCLANNATYEYEFNRQYPPLINDPQTVAFVQSSLASIMDKSRIQTLEEPSMGGEDFAYLANAVPSTFMFVGIAKDGQPAPVHHHPAFGFDDNILKDSSSLLAWLAIDYLDKHK